jgi:hypothetical protein
MSQRWAALSKQPVITHVPSGEKVAAITGAPVPEKAWSWRAVVASQSRAVPSRLAVSTYLPWGENTAVCTSAL